MRIGFVSQWYPPETGAAALPGVIAQALQTAGHDVEVLTGIPNYPTGKLYAGYRYAFNRAERIEGTTVHRVPVFTNHTRNGITRMANYLSFSATAGLAAPWRLRNFDLIWVHATPITAAVPAMFAHALRDKPYILHIQDLWPDTVTASGMISPQRAAIIETPINWFCNAAYRGAASTPVISPGMRNALLKRGVPEHKVEFLPNWCDEEAFQPAERDPELAQRLGIHRPFTVMYAGSLGEIQGISVLVEAANLLRDRRDIGFAIVGDGITKDSLRRRADELRLDNIAFAPSQPMKTMSAILALGDMQLISLIDNPLFHITLPSKVQATLASGRPIICAAPGDAAAVVRDADAGIVIPPGDPQALADAIRRCRDSANDRARWAVNGRAYYRERLSQAHAIDRIRAMIDDAVARPKSGSRGERCK